MISLKVDEPKAVSLKVAETLQSPSGGANDYNALANKPKLDGVTIQGDMREKDPTVPSWAKTPERPVYSPEDVGAVGEDDVTIMTVAELNELWNTL